eukprot:scaffold14968_cov70-Cyclotella_meneghiniana.AAC.1
MAIDLNGFTVYKNGQQDTHFGFGDGKNPIRSKSQLQNNTDFKNTSRTCLVTKLVETINASCVRFIALAMCHKPTMLTLFLRIFSVSSENRPQTVILANLALFSPYFARANPDSSEGRP